jgi:DNA replication protein DnaC
MELRPQLTPYLKSLHLSGILATLETRNRQAIEDRLSYVDFLGRLLEDEVERRDQKRLSLRLRRAAFPDGHTLESFDFAFNPQINRQKVLDLATCTFIERKENVLICGPTGVGKSHLAQALGNEACRRGYDTIFAGTHKMLAHLNGGRADGAYGRRLATYLRPDLLILDDFGLKPLRPPGPEDLFDVIAGRYQRRSIIVTSNRAMSEWADYFDSPLLASAGLDRLAHNAHTLIITGPSYRAKGRTASGPAEA